MRISDWSSDVCASDLGCRRMMRRGSKMSALVLTGSAAAVLLTGACMAAERKPYAEDDEVQPRSQLSPCSTRLALVRAARFDASASAEEVLESTLEAERLVGIEENVEILPGDGGGRSGEQTSELQSLKRISYAVFWLKKKNRDQD